MIAAAAVGALTMAVVGGSASAATKSTVAPKAVPVASVKAKMTATFLQPSINTAYPTINWSVARLEQEFALEKAAGITVVIDQWTVDQDANQAYYPDGTGWYPQHGNMVGNVITAAQAEGMTVWLGLANTYAWQSRASDSAWLSNQSYDDEVTANQLYALYGTKIAGWYISNELDDSLLSTPADAAPMTSFFTGLTTYLHSHDGNKKVMESPRFSGLNQSNTQFASTLAAVEPGMDVINVQDSCGSGYINASNMAYWFSALDTQFAGTSTAVWSNPDMFSGGTYMPPATLQADLQAEAPYVSGISGFSFTTEMDPAVIGTSTPYQTYKSYELTQ